MDLPRIEISSKLNAAKILSKAETRKKFQHLISIGADSDGVPRTYGLFKGPKLRLLFDDISRPSLLGYRLATTEDIEELIGFCRVVEGSTLIHCQAGISRSTAAAAILLATKLGPGQELNIMNIIKDSKNDDKPVSNNSEEEPWPNKHLIDLADRIMGLDGKLLAAAHEVFKHFHSKHL